LLHGFGGGPSDWVEVSAELAKTSRVVLPNLKTFFSHAEPLSFSKQVSLLAEFIQSLYGRKSVDTINLMGQSYGATLSIGLRLQAAFSIGSHTLLNPMPFRPLQAIRNPEIQILANMGSMPGGVKMFLKSTLGRRGLEELAKVFRIGALGHHEVQHFNDRKLLLVEKAFERFRWIVMNEDWDFWEQKSKNLRPGEITRFLYSSGDSLFNPEDYRKWAEKFKAKEIVEVPHQGHLLVQDIGSGILPK
jgi:pimeloyl-ACP methyl ester carboxylesterase